MAFTPDTAHVLIKYLKIFILRHKIKIANSNLKIIIIIFPRVQVALKSTVLFCVEL